MSKRQVRYDLSKFKDCLDATDRKILAFTIRSTDGTDEAYASKRAESKGVGVSMSEELIRFSIVSFEIEGNAAGDQPKSIIVVHPFEEFDKWSTKARNFVFAAWKKIATPADDELADFFKSASETE